MVFLEAPQPHIRVIWGSQFANPSFAQPTQEEKKVLAFARDIRIGLLPATVVVYPECLTPGEVAVPQETEMETWLTTVNNEAIGLTPTWRDSKFLL